MTEEEFHKAISKSENLDAVNDIYIDVVKSSDFGENLYKLTNPQKLLYYVVIIEKEIYNGGFNQYFFNSSGNDSEEALNGLIEIKAEKSAVIVKQAFDLWPNETVPKDRYTRQELLEDVEIYANASWDKLDDEFCLDQDNLTDKLFQYILNNSDKFYH
jgi:hypothetical protein